MDNDVNFSTVYKARTIKIPILGEDGKEMQPLKQENVNMDAINNVNIKPINNDYAYNKKESTIINEAPLNTSVNNTNINLNVPPIENQTAYTKISPMAIPNISQTPEEEEILIIDEPESNTNQVPQEAINPALRAFLPPSDEKTTGFVK